MLSYQYRNGLCSLYAVTGVPLLVINQNAEEIYSSSEDFMGFYSPDFLKSMRENLSQSEYPDGILLFCTGGFYYFALTRLDTEMFLATALISAEAFPGYSALRYTKWCIKPECLEEFYKVLIDLPTLNNHQLAHIVSLGRQIYTGRCTEDISIAYKTDIEDPKPGKPLKESLRGNAGNKKRDTNEEVDALVHMRTGDRESLTWRRAFIEAVKNGNMEKFISLFKGKERKGIGWRSMNPLQRVKYSYIAFISQLNFVIEEDNSIPWNDVIKFSDYYCQKMDSMTSVDEILSFKIKTGIDYCKKVWQYKGYGYNTYSTVTRKCCDYIQSRLYHKITINKIASAVGLNRHSLAIYFKRDTGIGIPEYINSRRMEEAAYLLVTTTQSILDISQMLHYSSQSFFGKKFKECFGITPQQYRNKSLHISG
jgi:AraC-like DNA-binding protein